MRKNNLFMLTLITFILISTIVLAHPGSLDSNGGHYNRKTGEYHYHDGTHTEGSSSNSNYNTFQDKKIKNNISSSQKTKSSKKSLKAHQNLGYEVWFVIILIVGSLLVGLIMDFKNTLLMIISVPFVILSFFFELLWEILKGILIFLKKIILKIF